MSILFIVMKPFSIDCNNAYIRRTVFGLLWVVLIFISGYGGFSGGDTLNSDGSPSDNIPVVFFQGQVQFPGGANASIQKVSAKNQNLRLNISQTIQNVQELMARVLDYLSHLIYFFKIIYSSLERLLRQIVMVNSVLRIIN